VCLWELQSLRQALYSFAGPQDPAMGLETECTDCGDCIEVCEKMGKELTLRFSPLRARERFSPNCRNAWCRLPPLRMAGQCVLFGGSCCADFTSIAAKRINLL
jgi:hypothetical protein